jgi:hypothetical protein
VENSGEIQLSPMKIKPKPWMLRYITSYLTAIRASVSCTHLTSSVLGWNMVEICISICRKSDEVTEDCYKTINNSQSSIYMLHIKVEEE